MSPFVFVPLSRSDLPLVQAWLELPHVQAAFGDSDEWLAEISSNLTSDWIRRFRADLVGIPAGFVQYYDTTRAPKGAWSSQPRGSFGIDFFLGDPALLRHGHGTRLVEQLAQFVELAAHPTRLIVDPETWNLASIRIARATGFVLDPPTGLWIKDFGRG